MAKSMFVELEEGVEYELVCASYTSGTPQSYDYPGDSPEADIAMEVPMYLNGKRAGEVKYQEFVALYAKFHGLDLAKADTKITNDFTYDIEQQYAEDHDSRFDYSENDD